MTGILGGTALCVLLLYAYTHSKNARITNITAITLIGALVLVNLGSVLYRTSTDTRAYKAQEPSIKGSLALLNYVAIQRDNAEIMGQLLTRGVPVDAVDNQGGEYMHHVAELNRIEMFSSLMSLPGINLDDKNVIGETPIQIAVENGYVDLVKLLLKNDVDPVNKNDRGQTLLHRATRNSDLELMNLLLEHSDVLNTPDIDGITPLSLAILQVDMELVELLIDSGADVNTQVDEDHTFFELVVPIVLKELQTDDGIAEEDEKSILSTIEQAILLEAELNGQDEDGKTPLHWVTRLHDRVTRTDENNILLTGLTLLLMENGADHRIENNMGEKALTLEHVIRHNYDQWLVKVIETDTAYLNEAQINGRSLFQYAIELGNSDTLAKLFEYGLEPKEWVPKVMVPIKYVVQHNDLATAKLLLEQKWATPEPAGFNMDTPVHLASSLNQSRMIELLIEYGYGVNDQGLEGNTPLHYAVETGSTFSILVLVENNADPSIWNSEGKRPIDLARDLGDSAIVDVIKSAADKFDRREQLPRKVINNIAFTPEHTRPVVYIRTSFMIK